jgi:phosphatidylserine/phosphatidylglycerophosphate/cardiolipin synthase-like enzyme
MQRYGVRTLCHLATSVALAFGMVSLSAGTASAAYSPQRGATFNRPIGTTAQKYALIRQFNNAIDSTPAGETIRIAIYSIDKDIPAGSDELTTAQHLVRAHERGVVVKILVDDHLANAQVGLLKRELGTDRSKPSYIHVCVNGCRTGPTGSLHEKLYLFSASGSSQLVVMISSSNPTNTQAATGWNNTYAIVNEAPIYDLFTKTFDEEMQVDTKVADPYRTLTVSNKIVTLFPRPGTTAATDNVLHALSMVQCSGATGESGFKGKTVVKVGVFSWGDSRGEAIAKKLWSLENNGCYVSVIMANAAGTFRSILLKPAAGRRVIDLYDSLIDTNGNGIPDKYSHNKYLLISGHFTRSSHDHYVLTGSQNYTNASLRNADEIQVGVFNGENYTRYNRDFKDIVAHGARKLTQAKTPDIFKMYVPLNADGEVD